MSAICRKSWSNMSAISTIGAHIDRWDNGRLVRRYDAPFIAQALEDLLRAVGVRVQQPRDAPLEGVKEAAARGWTWPLETRTCQPLGNRPGIETHRSSGLNDRQALALMAVADFAERLVVDHAGGLWDRARISRPRRSNRSVVRTRSSCSGVPTRWAIKPIRTAGCAVRTSCNGDRTSLVVLL